MGLWFIFSKGQGRGEADAVGWYDKSIASQTLPLAGCCYMMGSFNIHHGLLFHHHYIDDLYQNMTWFYGGIGWLDERWINTMQGHYGYDGVLLYRVW